MLPSAHLAATRPLCHLACVSVTLVVVARIIEASVDFVGADLLRRHTPTIRARTGQCLNAKLFTL